MRLAGRGGSGSLLRLRRGWGTWFPGRVVRFGAGLRGGGGTLGRSGRVTGGFGLGRCFCSFGLLLLAELGGQAGFEGESARREAGGAAAGPRVTVAAARA